MNFVQTQDESTAERLKKQGLQLLNKQGNIWTFLNDKKLCFSGEDAKNTVLTNKMCI